MKRTVPLAAALMLASGTPTLAQPAETLLRFEARHFDSSNNAGWGSEIAAVPGNHIEVRAVVSFIGIGPVVALGQISFQPLVSNWSLEDLLITSGVGAMQIGPTGSNITTPPGYVPDMPGAYGRITPWASGVYTTSTFLRGHVHLNPTGDGVNYLRIARADVTNWIGVGPTSGPDSINNTNGGGGVGINQGTIGSGRGANQPPQVLGTQNLIVFKFGFVLGNADGVRSLGMSAWLGPLNEPPPIPPPFWQPDTRWHTSENSSSPGTYRTRVQVENAAIHVLPSPGAGVMIVLMALMGVRARKRSYVLQETGS